MKEYVGIYIKIEKAQEQDGFGNKMKYHFHITTLHKYRFFVFCLYSSYISNIVSYRLVQYSGTMADIVTGVKVSHNCN